MSHDTLLHRAVRPLVIRLSRTRITPDALTTLRLATGLAAAGCVAVGHGPAMMAGAAIFLVSLLLDRADGALARKLGRTSRIGPVFDLVSDCLSTMALFVGLGIGIGARSGALAPSNGLLPGLMLGLIAAVAVAITFLQLSRPEMAGPPDVSRPFDPDDAMLIVPFAIWFGQAAWVLYLAASITPFAAIALVVISQARRRRSQVARLAIVSSPSLD